MKKVFSFLALGLSVTLLTSSGNLPSPPPDSPTFIICDTQNDNECFIFFEDGTYVVTTGTIYGESSPTD